MTRGAGIRIGSIALGLATALLGAHAGSAHHSFAAFFDPSKTVSVKGTVQQFAFTNPHGTIVLKVPGPNGSVQEWRAETNAPVVLVRRGWSRDVIKPGDVITIEGWPARDGKHYLRLRRALRADGSPIGVPFGQGDS
jgi:uncharacterized protein DUF6152